MPAPSGKRVRKETKEPGFVPHPDDAADVRAAFESVDRGEVLSAEESAAYLQALLGEGDSSIK
jgi:hypothetical protein